MCSGFFLYNIMGLRESRGDFMNITTVSGKNGEEILNIEGMLLHSKYNPKVQAIKKAKESYKSNYVHILFGYGNGYLVDALIEEFQYGETLIIIDPLISMDYIKPIVKYENEHIFVHNDFHNIKEFINNLVEIEHEGFFQTICSFNYDKLFPKEYKYFLECVRDRQQANIVNDNTIILRAKDWQFNFLENLPNILKNESIGILENKYKGPIVVASGGPSLTKQLALIKEYRNTIILIAAGSTINSLLKNDIYPDFVLSIDGHIANKKQFSDIYSNKINLVYSYFNHPEIAKHFKNQYYFSDSFDNKNTSFLKGIINKEIPTLLGGGTVAHFSLTFSEFISSIDTPIAMVGQDLAYTNDLTHAEGNKQYGLVDEARDFIYLDGYYGEKVKSSVAFNSMKVQFEILIKHVIKNTDRVFNCTEGGVKIDGFKQIPFSKFLTTYATDTLNAVNLDDNTIKVKNNNFIGTVKEYEDLCDEALLLIADGLKKLQRNKSLRSFDLSVLKALDKIDSFLHENQDQLPIQYIMQYVNVMLAKQKQPLEKELGTEVFSKVKSKNETIYKEIEKTFQHYKKILKKIKNSR